MHKGTAPLSAPPHQQPSSVSMWSSAPHPADYPDVRISMFWSSGPGVCLSSQHPLPPSTSKRPARALLKPSCIACGAPSCPVSRSEGSVQPLNPHPYHPGRRVPSYVSEALARTLPPIPAAVAPAAAHQLLLPPLWTAPPARLQEVPLSPASRSTEPPGPSSRDTSSSPAGGVCIRGLREY